MVLSGRYCCATYHLKAAELLNTQKIYRKKVVFRSHKSKDRQYNSQMKKDNRTNNDLQNTTQNTKDRATGTPLQTGCSERGWNSSSFSRTRRVRNIPFSHIPVL
jgi:hypothetical protein